MKSDKILVLSGIGLFEGGPLSIYYDCIESLMRYDIHKKYQIIALVHKKELFDKYMNYIDVIELPNARKSYIFRLFYEYIYFWFFSQKRNIHIWISLHDITPKVKADKQYTYCHNPSPFMEENFSNIRYGFANVIFPLFYKYLYRINIKSASAVIVQQDWIRKAFQNMFPINNIIVANPNLKINYKFSNQKRIHERYIFIYAAYPRFFKNYEIICQAAQYMQRDDYEVWFTIDGTENTYSKELYMKYKNISNIKWLGLQPRNKIFDLYEKSDCLIFPSTLETWGLPISEYKETGKPILLADLPYAHETLGEYNKCLFFEARNYKQLADYMEKLIGNRASLDTHKKINISQPYARNWDELVKLIVD